MPLKYAKEFIGEVMDRYHKGESIESLSQDLHIAQSTLYEWRKKYCTISTPRLRYTPAEFDAMSHRIKKLEHELEIIRMTGLISKVPVRQRVEALAEIYNQPGNTYHVRELCDALEVARGTFYNHIFRRVDQSYKHEEQLQLMLLVQQIFNDSKQRLGADKIRAVLLQSDIHVSKKRIAAIMQELDLHSVRTSSKKTNQFLARTRKQNVVKGEFAVEAPNTLWVSDITSYNLGKYWVHLCIIMDVYARKIVGYRVSRNMSKQLVTATFRQAFKERGNPQGLTFHSDRGSQYTSNAVMNLLHECGVKQSFSAPGRPRDNPLAESFNASFKQEEVYRREYTSEQHFRKCVDEFIRYYNEKRPHKGIRNVIPHVYEMRYYESLAGNTCSNMGAE